MIDALSNNTLNPPVRLTTSQAPADSVAQFTGLLQGMKSAFSAGQVSLTPPEKPLEIKGDMLQDTALRVNTAEVGLQEIAREIQKGIQPMEDAMTLDSDFTKSIVYQQFGSATYFINLSRVESGASNVSEEFESITRKR